MNTGIYKITNIINNKFYIGSTNNLKRRRKEHFSLLSKNKNHCKILQRAYNKYGKDAFIFEIIAYCPVKYLFKLEQWFVDNLKPQYNSCLIDVSVPIGLSGKGYLYTEKHKEIKRQEALKRLSENSSFGWKSRIIEKLDDSGNVIREYESLKAYAKEYGCSIGNVGKALKEGNKCKGFNIRYKHLP